MPGAHLHGKLWREDPGVSNFHDIYQAIPTTSGHVASGGAVFFKKMRDMIRFEFESVEVLHVPRSCNSVAHELARFSAGGDTRTSL